MFWGAMMLKSASGYAVALIDRLEIVEVKGEGESSDKKRKIYDAIMAQPNPLGRYGGGMSYGDHS